MTVDMPRRGLPYKRRPSVWYSPTPHKFGHEVYGWDIGAHAFIASFTPGKREWFALPRGAMIEELQDVEGRTT